MVKQKLHDCKKCQRKFLNLQALMIHMKYFHNKKKQAKLTSNISRKRSSDKTVNETRAQSKYSTPLKCELCNKLFSRIFTLNRHIAVVHEKQKKYQCHICNKCFGRQVHVQLHIDSVHDKLKPHKCSLCAKSFSSKGNVNKHIDMAHKNLRPHVCQICNKRFNTKQVLKTHIECVHQKIKKHAAKMQ